MAGSFYLVKKLPAFFVFSLKLVLTEGPKNAALRALD